LPLYISHNYLPIGILAIVKALARDSPALDRKNWYNVRELWRIADLQEP